MSRSGYVDDCDDEWQLIRWQGAVKSALRGRRGQAFLRELIAALDALPEKRLIANSLSTDEGCCALGAVGRARRMNVRDLDPQNMESIAAAFGLADAMSREIVWINDEEGYGDTPESRWLRVRRWAESELR